MSPHPTTLSVCPGQRSIEVTTNHGPRQVTGRLIAEPIFGRQWIVHRTLGDPRNWIVRDLLTGKHVRTAPATTMRDALARSLAILTTAGQERVLAAFRSNP